MFKHYFEPQELLALHSLVEVSMQNVRAETARFGAEQTRAVLSRAVIKIAKAGRLSAAPGIISERTDIPASRSTSVVSSTARHT